MILDIYRRASKHLPLTPGERAFLRWVDTLILSVVSAAATAMGYAFWKHGGTLSWQDLAQAGVYAALTAILLAVAKYFRALGDTDLGAWLGQIAGQTAAKDGLPAAPEALIEASVPVPPETIQP